MGVAAGGGPRNWWAASECEVCGHFTSLKIMRLSGKASPHKTTASSLGSAKHQLQLSREERVWTAFRIQITVNILALIRNPVPKLFCNSMLTSEI
eukprot:2701584-Rhodomonas_salina.1